MLWYKWLRPRLCRGTALVCGMLSAAIVLGQCTMFSEQSSSWSLIPVLFRSRHGFGQTQILCVLPFGYMICTAYWSVLRLKISGVYGLYPDHNTDSVSLLWCALILARLAAPLCYHFLLLARLHGTQFQHFMGQMDVVPVLGGSFNKVFPALVGILCLCNLLDLYARVVQCLGLYSFAFEGQPVEHQDLAVQGKRLIERERWRLSEASTLVLDRQSGNISDDPDGVELLCRDSVGARELRLPFR